MELKSTPPPAEPANLPTSQQTVNEGIARVIAATGIDVQKNRYKAMRAIAWQSFVDAIEEGTFDALVKRAIANVDALPSGWEISASARVEPNLTSVKRARAKKTA